MLRLSELRRAEKVEAGGVAGASGGRARVLRPTKLESRGRARVPRPRPTKAEADEMSGGRAICGGRAEGTWGDRASAEVDESRDLAGVLRSKSRGRAGVEADESRDRAGVPWSSESRGRRKKDRDGVSEFGQGTEAMRSCRSAVDVAEVGGRGRQPGWKLARGQRPRRTCAVVSSSSLEMSGATRTQAPSRPPRRGSPM